MRRRKPFRVQKRTQLCQLLRKVIARRSLPLPPQSVRLQLSAARRPPNPQIDPPRKHRFQRAKDLRDLVRRIMRQHHAA